MVFKPVANGTLLCVKAGFFRSFSYRVFQIFLMHIQQIRAYNAPVSSVLVL